MVDSCRWCDCNLKRLCGAHLSPLHSSPGARRQHLSIRTCVKWAPLVTVYLHCNAVSLVGKHTLDEYSQARGARGGLWTTRTLFCQLNRLEWHMNVKTTRMWETLVKFSWGDISPAWSCNIVCQWNNVERKNQEHPHALPVTRYELLSVLLWSSFIDLLTLHSSITRLIQWFR